MKRDTVGHLCGALWLGASCTMLWFVVAMLVSPRLRGDWMLTLALLVGLGGLLSIGNFAWRVLRARAVAAGLERLFNGVAIVCLSALAILVAAWAVIAGDFSGLDPQLAVLARVLAGLGGLGGGVGLVWGTKMIFRPRRGRFLRKVISHG